MEKNFPSKGGWFLLSGINSLALDAKGRLAIPTRYRERLEELCASQLVITIDPEDRCLLIYPHLEWKKIEERLARLPSLNKVARRLQRLLVGHAHPVEMDRQGRVVIPPMLRDFAGLQSQVVLTGQMNKFELWDEVLWNEQRDLWLKETDLEALEDAPELKSLAF